MQRTYNGCHLLIRVTQLKMNMKMKMTMTMMMMMMRCIVKRMSRRSLFACVSAGSHEGVGRRIGTGTRGSQPGLYYFYLSTSLLHWALRYFYINYGLLLLLLLLLLRLWMQTVAEHTLSPITSLPHTERVQYADAALAYPKEWGSGATLPYQSDQTFGQFSWR